MNIILAVDDEVARKAQKLADDQNITLAELVQAHLEALAEQQDANRELAARRLSDMFDRISRPMGPRTWTREDLYDRKILSGHQPPVS